MQDNERLRELFERAMEQPAPLRMAFLGKCGLEPARLKQLAKLISAAERETGFMPTGGIKRSTFEPKLAIGTQVADWQVHAFLGVGGMGEVYAVKRQRDGFTQSGALKIGPLDPVEQVRFFNERFLLAKLEHPNIARLIDGGTDPHAGAFMVMEHVEGKPLLEAVRNSTLKTRLASAIDLISAVAYAHARLILHRDIKPSNILMDEQGRLRLIDFGVGLDFETEPTDFSSPSTPGYAAPEQRLGGTVTVAADIYALGRVLLDLAEMDEAGRRRRSRVPDDLGAVIGKATAQNPSERYESADALADDIRRFLDGQAVRARGASNLYIARRFVQRHWLSSTALALLFVSLVGGLILTTQAARRAEAAAAATNLALTEQAFEARTSAGYRELLQNLYAFAPIDPSHIDTALLEEAARSARGAAAANASDLFRLFAIGQHFHYRGDFEAASIALEPFDRLPFSDSDIVLEGKSMLARSWSQSGRREDGLRLARAIINWIETHGQATAAALAPNLMVIAETTNEEADYRAVIRNAEQAISETAPIDSVGYFHNQIGAAYLQLEEWDAAVDAMAAAFEDSQTTGPLTPNDVTSASNLALLSIYLKGDPYGPLQFLDSYATAAEFKFNQALDAGFLHGLKAMALLMSDDPAHALEAADQAISLVGRNYGYREGWILDVHLMKAQALIRQGQQTSGLAVLNEVEAEMETPVFMEEAAPSAEGVATKVFISDLIRAEATALSGDLASAILQRDAAIERWLAETEKDDLPRPLKVIVGETNRVLPRLGRPVGGE